MKLLLILDISIPRISMHLCIQPAMPILLIKLYMTISSLPILIHNVL